MTGTLCANGLCPTNTRLSNEYIVYVWLNSICRLIIVFVYVPIVLEYKLGYFDIQRIIFELACSGSLLLSGAAATEG